MNQKANLAHKFSAVLNSVMLQNREIKYEKQDETVPLMKYGYALRDHNDDGADTYRIPGLAITNKGTLIAVYDVRWNNGSDLQGDIDVGMSRSFDGGQTWEPMQIIMDRDEWGNLPEDQNGVGDPTVLVDEVTGDIWVAALWAHGHPDRHFWGASEQGISPGKTGQLLLTKSEDDGASWSDLINITEQIKDPQWYLMFNGPGNGITTSNGTLVFPAQYVDQSAGYPSMTQINDTTIGVLYESSQADLVFQKINIDEIITE